MPNGRRRQQNTRQANRNRNRANDSVIVASPVFESTEPIIVQSENITELEHKLQNLEHLVNTMKENRKKEVKKVVDIETKLNKLKNIEKKYQKLKSQYDIHKELCIQEQTLNIRYKAKIKELLIDLEKAQNKYKNLDEATHDVASSTQELMDVTMKNRIISTDLIIKLKRVKSDLPTNFDTKEWNNKHFVEFLIDLTLDELLKLKF
tara:strand:- start:915 stop:1532 length:618 start_codon:yes stop_codon:yes gene_type:complete